MCMLVDLRRGLGWHLLYMSKCLLFGMRCLWEINHPVIKNLLPYAGLVYATDAQGSARVLAAARAAHAIPAAGPRPGNMGPCRGQRVRGADQCRVQRENRIIVVSRRGWCIQHMGYCVVSVLVVKGGCWRYRVRKDGVLALGVRELSAVRRWYIEGGGCLRTRVTKKMV